MNSKNVPNRIMVSRVIGFRAHSTDPSKVFCVMQGKREVLFGVMGMKGKQGRPKIGAEAGFGSLTKVRIKVYAPWGKKVAKRATVSLSSLVDAGVRYLGTRQTVFGIR